MPDSIVSSFVLLFVVIDPIGVAPMFAAMTHGYSALLSRRTAVRGVLIAFGIFVAFTLGGHALLNYLRVSMPAFTIAGGILLFLLAVDMVLVRQTGLRTATESEQEEAEHRADISVFPLAIPMIAGPGSLTTVLLLAGEHGSLSRQTAVIIAMVVVVLLVTLLLLLTARQIQQLLGETGVNAVSRLFGIVLAALAVQFVLNGIRESFPNA